MEDIANTNAPQPSAQTQTASVQPTQQTNATGQQAQPQQTAPQNTGNAAPAQQEAPKETEPLGVKDDLMGAYDGGDATQDNAQPEAKTETQQEAAQAEQQEETKSDPLDAIPETYAFIDDSGANIEMPDEDRAAYNAAFKEAKLTQRQANSLYKSYQEAGRKIAEQINNQYRDAFIQRSKDWIAQIKSDPEIGGDHYNDTKSNIGRVMARFGTPALRQYLNESQDGYNPDLVRFFNNVGKALAEDTFVNGNGGAPTQEDRIKMDQGLYPNSPDTWGK